MAWRIHLTNQAINHLHILPSKPATLAVWTRNDQVHFYDLETGTLLSQRQFQLPLGSDRQSDTWRQFLSQLSGPDAGSYLPYVRTPGLEIYSTDDGKQHLYRNGYDVVLDTGEGEISLDMGTAQAFTALDFDRALGTVAALDEEARLHIYQQDIRVGMFEVGLRADDEYFRPLVAIPRGGGNIFVSDGHRIVLTDSGGSVLKRFEAHYDIGRMACSPAGGMLVTSDVQAGVLRLYKGDTLTPTHQRFAIDLIADATQVQLLADLPPTSVGISALTAHARGVMAFAMAGVVCVTDNSFMDELPRPQPLL